MTTTETRNKLGITVAKDLRTLVQGKVAIAGEASYGNRLQASVFHIVTPARNKDAHEFEQAR
jgi:hypothetical protein